MTSRSQNLKMKQLSGCVGQGKGSWLWLALQLLEQAKPPELLRALKHAALAGGLL
jgi:hypothetical protein